MDNERKKAGGKEHNGAACEKKKIKGRDGDERVESKRAWFYKIMHSYNWFGSPLSSFLTLFSPSLLKYYFNIIFKKLFFKRLKIVAFLDWMFESFM